nr:MAG TPA: hypothetical protein [Siphoviridae sp. ctqOv4]DAZ28684.1 MAG TPA: hypothetical protein [Caudoviricetes sp.]
MLHQELLNSYPILSSVTHTDRYKKESPFQPSLVLFSNISFKLVAVPLSVYFTHLFSSGFLQHVITIHIQKSLVNTRLLKQGMRDSNPLYTYNIEQTLSIYMQNTA